MKSLGTGSEIVSVMSEIGPTFIALHQKGFSVNSGGDR